jgi:hypothetical protein
MEVNSIQQLASYHELVEEQSKLPIYELQKSNVKHIVDSALHTPYMLTPVELKQLESITNGQPIRMSDKVRYGHPHAIGHICQNTFAYGDVKRNFGHIDGVIDHGGSPLRTPANHHPSVLINCMQTSSRYINASLSDYLAGEESDYSYLFRSKREVQHNYNNDIYIDTTWEVKVEDHLSCTNGSQVCTHKSPVGYAVNVYDIPISDLPEIFARHDHHIMDFYMFLPHALIDSRYNIDQTFFVLRHNKDGTVDFSFRDDYSNVYTHELKNWRSYLMTRVIHGREFSILSQIIKRWGPFFHIRFTRTPYYTGNPRLKIPLGDYYKGYYKITDVMFWLSGVNHLHKIGMMWYIAPKAFVDQVMSHGYSTNETTFSWPNFFNIARSYQNGVKFYDNGVQRYVYEGLSCSSEEFFNIVFSLFIISANKRRIATQKIKIAMNDLKTMGDDFYRIMVAILKKSFRTIFNPDDDIETFLINDLNERLSHANEYMSHLQIQNIHDIYVDEVIHCKQVSDLVEKPMPTIDYPEELRFNIRHELPENDINDIQNIFECEFKPRPIPSAPPMISRPIAISITGDNNPKDKCQIKKYQETLNKIVNEVQEENNSNTKFIQSLLEDLVNNLPIGYSAVVVNEIIADVHNTIGKITKSDNPPVDNNNIVVVDECQNIITIDETISNEDIPPQIDVVLPDIPPIDQSKIQNMELHEFLSTPKQPTPLKYIKDSKTFAKDLIANPNIAFLDINTTPLDAVANIDLKKITKKEAIKIAKKYQAVPYRTSSIMIRDVSITKNCILSHFDVARDGNCGLHVIRELCRRSGTNPNIPDEYIQRGKKGAWLAHPEMLELLKINRINALFHITDNTRIINIEHAYNGKYPTYSILSSPGLGAF